MKSTFSVIYYLKRQVVKKDGTVPVMGRITVDGSQTQFSCKLTVDPICGGNRVELYGDGGLPFHGGGKVRRGRPASGDTLL